MWLSILVHGEEKRYHPGAFTDIDWYVHSIPWVYHSFIRVRD